MANFTVVWDAAAYGRLDAAEATTNWTAEGISGLAAEPDWFYQGSNCISGLVKTSEVGFYCAPGSTAMNGTPNRVWLVKLNQTNYAAIDGNGLQLRIGSDSSNYHYYYQYTASTYPLGGGFQIIAVDPNVSQWRTGTVLSPNLGSVNYFAIRSDCSATAKTSNLGLDAIDVMDVGTGLSGTGADTTGSFESFRTADEDTSSNRWGIVRSKEGIFYVTGMLSIGTAGGSSAATDFSASNRVLVFPDHKVTTGFCGIIFDLGNASTTIALSNCVFNGRGALYTSDDTRPSYTVNGTSGSMTSAGTTYNGFNLISTSATPDMQNNIFLNGRQVEPNGANFSGSDFQGCTGASDTGYVNWDVSTDPNGKLDNCSFTKGTTSTHAIEFDATNSPTTMTLVNHSYSGYNASDGQTDSTLYFKRTTGTVTVNYNGDLPSYKTAGATISLVSSVTVTLTGLIAGTEIRVYKTSDDSVVDGIESSSTSWAFSAASGLGVYMRIFHVQYLPADITGYTMPGTNTSIPIQQIFDRNYTP